jgi:ABC-type multidrug transport system permease subunit
MVLFLSCSPVLFFFSTTVGPTFPRGAGRQIGVYSELLAVPCSSIFLVALLLFRIFVFLVIHGRLLGHSN